MKGIERQIDKLGRIVLPIEYRRSLKLSENSTVMISLTSNSIVVSPIDKRCAICGSSTDLSDSVPLCEKCIVTVKKL